MEPTPNLVPMKIDNTKISQFPSNKSCVPVWSTLDALEKGVRGIFARWTALNLAVSGGWGGHSSEQKAQDLMFDVLDLYEDLEETQDVYADEIEIILLEGLEKNFNIMLEDDSANEISHLVVDLWHQLLKQDYSLFNETLLSPLPNSCQFSIFAGEVDKNGIISTPTSNNPKDNHNLANEEDDDDLEEDSQEDEEKNKDEEMQVENSGPVLSPEEEEEGWSVVSSKKSSKKH